MEISIKTSKRMDAVAGAEAQHESISLRVPRDLRLAINYNIGNTVSLRAKVGPDIPLIIESAYGEDAKDDSMCVYVTSATHSQVEVIGSQQDTAVIELVDGITLGCDPELMVIDKDSGDLVSAQYFFGLTKNAEIGFDGLLFELRPPPSTDEGVVVDNMYNLLTRARTHLNTCDLYPNLMLAGISSFHGRAAVARNIQAGTALFQPSTKLTAGFHLHYGLPEAILGYQKKFVAYQVVKALDYYVGFPSIIPEGHGDSYRRTVQGIGYGKPGQFRLDHRTLEYRTPGAALMKHPILAKGLIGLGAVVIEDIASRIKHITSGFTRLSEISNDADIRILYPNIPPIMEIFRSICSPTTDQAKKHLDTIRSDVEKMVGYARRAETINNFFNNIETVFPYDVEENWWRYKNHGERQSR